MRFTSSNPVLAKNDLFEQYYGTGALEQADPQAAAIKGVINKTAILVLITVAAGIAGYGLFEIMPGITMISGIAAVLVAIGLGFVMAGKPTLAPVLAPIYGVVEGVFLGGLTGLADGMLESRGLPVAGGVGVQAFIVTAACMVSMLVLYRTGIIKPTRRFQAVVATLTGGIMLAYLVSFVLSIFWQPLPLIGFASAIGNHGALGLLGLGLNLFILVVASLMLVIDFERVREHTTNGAPSHIQWFLGFGLLVTLAWIYFESVKLVVRIAVLFGGRD